MSKRRLRDLERLAERLGTVIGVSTTVDDEERPLRRSFHIVRKGAPAELELVLSGSSSHDLRIAMAVPAESAFSGLQWTSFIAGRDAGELVLGARLDGPDDASWPDAVGVVLASAPEWSGLSKEPGVLWAVTVSRAESALEGELLRAEIFRRSPSGASPPGPERAETLAPAAPKPPLIRRRR